MYKLKLGLLAIILIAAFGCDQDNSPVGTVSAGDQHAPMSTLIANRVIISDMLHLANSPVFQRAELTDRKHITTLDLGKCMARVFGQVDRFVRVIRLITRADQSKSDFRQDQLQ